MRRPLSSEELAHLCARLRRLPDRAPSFDVEGADLVHELPREDVAAAHAGRILENPIQVASDRQIELPSDRKRTEAA